MKEFSEDEKIIARSIDQKYKWIARDKSGSLYVYSLKPVKRECVKTWGNSSSEIACVNVLFNKELFRTIKWEDDEPTRIRDIYDPQILDDVERKYLKLVLRPFHERVNYVGKFGRHVNDNGTCSKEYLYIKLHDEELVLPEFDAGKMYSGMEFLKLYKLDELGITYNVIDTATDALKADTQTEDYTTPEDKYSKEDIDNAVNMIHDYCAAHHDTCNCCYLAHSIFCDVKNPESWRRFSGEEL